MVSSCPASASTAMLGTTTAAAGSSLRSSGVECSAFPAVFTPPFPTSFAAPSLVAGLGGPLLPLGVDGPVARSPVPMSRIFRTPSASAADFSCGYPSQVYLSPQPAAALPSSCAASVASIGSSPHPPVATKSPPPPYQRSLSPVGRMGSPPAVTRRASPLLRATIGASLPIAQARSASRGAATPASPQALAAGRVGASLAVSSPGSRLVAAHVTAAATTPSRNRSPPGSLKLAPAASSGSLVVPSGPPAGGLPLQRAASHGGSLTVPRPSGRPVPRVAPGGSMTLAVASGVTAMLRAAERPRSQQRQDLQLSQAPHAAARQTAGRKVQAGSGNSVAAVAGPVSSPETIAVASSASPAAMAAAPAEASGAGCGGLKQVSLGVTGAPTLARSAATSSRSVAVAQPATPSKSPDAVAVVGADTHVGTNGWVAARGPVAGKGWAEGADPPPSTPPPRPRFGDVVEATAAPAAVAARDAASVRALAARLEELKRKMEEVEAQGEHLCDAARAVEQECQRLARPRQEQKEKQPLSEWPCVPVEDRDELGDAFVLEADEFHKSDLSQKIHAAAAVATAPRFAALPSGNGFQL